MSFYLIHNEFFQAVFQLFVFRNTIFPFSTAHSSIILSGHKYIIFVLNFNHRRRIFLIIVDYCLYLHQIKSC